MPYGRGAVLKPLLDELPAVLKDAALLKSPVIDSAVLATIVAVASPLGLNVGPDGAVITGILMAIGVIATTAERALAKKA